LLLVGYFAPVPPSRKAGPTGGGHMRLTMTTRLRWTAAAAFAVVGLAGAAPGGADLALNGPRPLLHAASDDGAARPGHQPRPERHAGAQRTRRGPALRLAPRAARQRRAAHQSVPLFKLPGAHRAARPARRAAGCSTRARSGQPA
jgi:hypothetical protein